MWNHGNYVVPSMATSTSTTAQLDSAKVALRQYMRAGGGFVGFHNAFGTEYNWPWYEGLLGNGNYYNHGGFRVGNVRVASSIPQTQASAGPGRSMRSRTSGTPVVPYPSDVKVLAYLNIGSQTSACTGLPLLLRHRLSGPAQGTDQRPRADHVVPLL